MQNLPYESAWPDEWTGRPRSGLLLFSAVFMGLLTVGAAAGVVSELRRGNAAGALIFVAMTVYLGHLAAIGLHSYGGGRHRRDTSGVRQGAEGLIFRYGALPTYLIGAFLALTTVALAGMAVVSAAQASASGVVICVVLTVLAILMLVFLVVFLRLAPGQVVIGPDGFHHRGLTFTHFVPWEAVNDVAALWAHSPVVFVRTIGSSATVTRNYLGRDTAGPQALSPFDTISGRWLAADPALLLRALAYYIVHPADRPELSTPAALHRIVGDLQV
uniref:hypothetical protein n=1 Tax=Paractinoplanes polyasparticus TaxID=2856853 RepID=UPI001C86547A|nr:hypothetical protein [Actinoplanes polyasparticus]